MPSRVLTRFLRSSGFFEKPFSAADFEKSSVNLLGAGERGRHAGEVELDHLAVIDRTFLDRAVHALGPEVGLEGVDLFLGAPGALEVNDGRVVHREEAHGRAVIGRHVGDRRAVGNGEAGRAFAEELDELVDDVGLAHELGDGEHEIGGGDAAAQRSLQVHADHVGGEEVGRLAEHAGLGFDAAHAPRDHADGIHHGRVAVGADQGVGIVEAVLLVHAARQVLEVHLVHDADAGRHHAEGIEGLHRPLHEGVALLVALELELHVEIERVLDPVVVDLDGVVHHEIDGNERLDHLGVLAEPLCDAPHRGEVGERWDSGQVLQQDAREHEGNFIGARRVRLPARQLADVLFGDFPAVAVAQHRLENDADRHRQARNPGAQRLFQGRQGIEPAGLARSHLEFLQRVEEIV